MTDTTSPASSCIFCRIAAGTEPAHRVWEDDAHLAFLSIFPNTEGITVVIPKHHHSSYAFALPHDVYEGLTRAAREVGLLLDRAFDDVGRTAMVLEGFGVDHVHAKLIPLHGTAAQGEWKPIRSDINTYFTAYKGYVSSHDADRAPDEALAKVAERIRQAAR